MLKVELKLSEQVFYAGDEISLEISLLKRFQLKHLQFLDGSIQFIGRSIFVNDFYSFPRVQELFGELGKVKEECKMFLTEKGSTFTLPFYITKPALLTLSNDTETIEWKGRLPRMLPPSFIGLFCSFQHVVQVKIVWKCVETGEIGVSQSELVFKVLHNPSTSKVILGVLDDFTEKESIDDVFPDNLELDETEGKLMYDKIKDMLKDNTMHSEDIIDNEEMIRSIVESDCGFNRSISIETQTTAEDNTTSSLTIGSVHLRKTCILPGTQIFITIDLNVIDRIEVIKLKLECVESYPGNLLRNEQLSWRDTVKELIINPGCRDRLEIIFPVPPELHASISSELYSLEWELGVNFAVDGQDFDMKIPLKFVPFKPLYYLTNKR